MLVQCLVRGLGLTYVCKYGGVDEISLFPMPGTSTEKSCTLLLTLLNVRQNLVKLGLGHLGSLVSFLVKGLPDLLILFRGLNELLQKFFVNTLLDVDSGCGGADLSIISIYPCSHKNISLPRPYYP